MFSVSQGLIDVATRGAGTSPILTECVITNDPSLQIMTINLDETYILTW